MKHTDKPTTTASARPGNVRTYTARFTGRQVGAIGIFQPFETTVEARNEEEARLALYDRFEHISNLSLCLMGHETASAPDPAEKRKGQLKRDGRVVMEGTEGEAMSYIHRNHCYSYTHALKHEGFSYDTAEEISIRKAMQ